MKLSRIVNLLFIVMIFVACHSTKSTAPLKVGDVVPSFSLLDENSVRFTSEKLKGQPAVIYFYPKDDSPVCTKEACYFRDEFSNFQNLNAFVAGISSDSPESHKRFKDAHKLPFTLLADTENKVRKLFMGNEEPLPRRVTYVIDKNGVIKYIFKDNANAEQHVQTALEYLKK